MLQHKLTSKISLLVPSSKDSNLDCFLEVFPSREFSEKEMENVAKAQWAVSEHSVRMVEDFNLIRKYGNRVMARF